MEFFKQDHKLQVQSLIKENLIPNPEWDPLSGVWNLLQKVRVTLAISRDYLSAYLFRWARLGAFWARYSFILMKHRYILMQHPCCSTAFVWRVMNSRFASFCFNRLRRVSLTETNSRKYLDLKTGYVVFLLSFWYKTWLKWDVTSVEKVRKSNFLYYVRV